jgi:hypothetical protein
MGLTVLTEFGYLRRARFPFAACPYRQHGHISAQAPLISLVGYDLDTITPDFFFL